MLTKICTIDESHYAHSLRSCLRHVALRTIKDMKLHNERLVEPLEGLQRSTSEDRRTPKIVSKMASQHGDTRPTLENHPSSTPIDRKRNTYILQVLSGHSWKKSYTESVDACLTTEVALDIAEVIAEMSRRVASEPSDDLMYSAITLRRSCSLSASSLRSFNLMTFAARMLNTVPLEVRTLNFS